MNGFLNASGIVTTVPIIETIGQLPRFFVRLCGADCAVGAALSLRDLSHLSDIGVREYRLHISPNAPLHCIRRARTPIHSTRVGH